MKKISIIFGWFFIFPFFATTAFSEDMGLFSPYLAGTYDLRNGTTLLQVVNPTAKDLDVYLAFFDADEKPLKCKKDKLSHNDLLEVDVKALKLDARFGVVKIVSFRDKKPSPGIIGFQRHIFPRVGVTESNMAAIPEKVLDKELEIILDVCR